MSDAGTCQEMPQPAAEAAAGSERLALPAVPSARLSKGAPGDAKALTAKWSSEGQG